MVDQEQSLISGNKVQTEQLAGRMQQVQVQQQQPIHHQVQ